MWVSDARARTNVHVGDERIREPLHLALQLDDADSQLRHHPLGVEHQSHLSRPHRKQTAAA